MYTSRKEQEGGAEEQSAIGLHAGQVLHISTPQGNLPLMVDAGMDEHGDVAVHGFREGIRYDGFIRLGAKRDGISFPRSVLHSLDPSGKDASQEVKVEGDAEIDGHKERVQGLFAAVQDNGIVTTVNTRAYPNAQGGLSYNNNFVYGAAGTPRTQVPRFPPVQQRQHAPPPLPQEDAQTAQRRAKHAKPITGYFDVKGDNFGAVNLQPTACAEAAIQPSCGQQQYQCGKEIKTTVHVDLLCPPYVAPTHGSVVYKGERFRGTTADYVERGWSEDEARKVVVIDGKEFPLADDGDIPACEQVRVECDRHYELDKVKNAFENPYCLSSGTWEKGKQCVPIMCDPFSPPQHGSVWPQGKIMAGDRVVVECDKGYQMRYEKNAVVNPQCLDNRNYELGPWCEPRMCDAYKAPAHGSVAPNGRTLVGQRVRITCDTGFHPQPASRTPFPNAYTTDHDPVGVISPMCLDTTARLENSTADPGGLGPHYELGVECVPEPMYCGPYKAPKHGSVWYQQQEYRVESPSGIEGWPNSQAVIITCDPHYRLTASGTQHPHCLRSGQWENGKRCDPITCDAFRTPAHSTFKGPKGTAMAGSRVFVTCDKGYEERGYDKGLARNPLCLDTARGFSYVPKEHPPPATPPPHVPPKFSNSPLKPVWIKEEEEGPGEPLTVHDYAPNAFDLEPRPISFPSRR